MEITREHVGMARRAARRFCCRLRPGTVDEDDIAQAALIAVWQGRRMAYGMIDEARAWTGWRPSTADRRRPSVMHVEFDDELHGSLDIDTPQTILERRQLLSLCARAFVRQTERDQSLVMAVLEGVSRDDVARRFGVSIDRVDQIVRRAREAMARRAG